MTVVVVDVGTTEVVADVGITTVSMERYEVVGTTLYVVGAYR